MSPFFSKLTIQVLVPTWLMPLVARVRRALLVFAVELT